MRRSSAVNGSKRRCGDFGRDHGGFLGHGAPALGERDRAAAAVSRIVERSDETAHAEPVDHALDGGGVEIDQAAEMVLRTGADFIEFGECCELGLRQAADHARHEDRGMALHGDAHQETDLIVQLITPRFRRSGGHHGLQFLWHHSLKPPDLCSHGKS